MGAVYWGEAKVRNNRADAQGDLVNRDGESYYRISNYDGMQPFFLSVVSGSDHWMYVSSRGGLTCGRKSPESSLFPYYSDDKIHDAASTTGPQTHFLVERAGRTNLWKPFARDVGIYDVQRNLYKNQAGNKLLFEEVNLDLELTYSYEWLTSERFGFIKKSRVFNLGASEVRIDLLDGLRNVLPYGVPTELQATMSTLIDAYKQAERVEGFDLGIYTMSSILTDRAEPSEALKATVVWCLGLQQPCILLSEDQVEAFCSGNPLGDETFSCGKRGAFFAQSSFVLSPGAENSWLILADIDQGPSDLAALIDAMAQGIAPEVIEQDVEAGTNRLRQLVGSSDGFQVSSDVLVSGRHFSNTLFNIMRGGTFYDEYLFPPGDFLDFLGAWNAPLRRKYEKDFTSQSVAQGRASVIAAAEASGDPDLERIALEYLPLTFSRRHGDPSRPWNHFSIDIKNPNGSDRLSYQGNWRDIFQNWEALAISYPEYTDSFVAKFVNASTADGYNPYRISKAGFDWEVLDTNDPWSNIGYWGDHQVNYLLAFLELSRQYHPGRLSDLLSREIFVFADVPYRLRGYQGLLRDPRNSVDYDGSHAEVTAGRVARLGSDGRLICLGDGSIYKVSLLEKLLVTLTVKIGNFVPGGGIWMNTQRPEWNDANNALVGFGLSMVTLCYLRRYLAFLADLLAGEDTSEYTVSEELAEFFNGLHELFQNNTFMLEGEISPADRKAFMDMAGSLGEAYRERVYLGFSGRKIKLEKAVLVAFINLSLAHMDQSIALSQREDGLFHSYGLIRFGNEGFDIEYLYEMLEGQVAVLKSGFLAPAESSSLLEKIRTSKLYRPDQNSYLLYPARKPAGFLEKNVIPPEALKEHAWIQGELKSGRRDFVEQDVNGNVHFAARFRNAAELDNALTMAHVGAADSQALCQLYENVFGHHRFTGRSGTMYKYEGLGCIYWHMVSKLLLAVSEVTTRAFIDGDSPDVKNQLLDHYNDIKEGLGLHKTPDQYGAFTVDPYSHTPAFAGVQQPGMTGQVKEDLITRFRELGLAVRDGVIHFLPVMLERSEFLSKPQTWHFSVGGAMQSLELEAGSLAFTLCGVPIIYRLAGSGSIQVVSRQGDTERLHGSSLGEKWSQSVFRREKRVLKIMVDIPEKELRTAPNVPQ